MPKFKRDRKCTKCLVHKSVEDFGKGKKTCFQCERKTRDSKWCASCGADSIDTDGHYVNGRSWYCYECAHVIESGEEE